MSNDEKTCFVIMPLTTPKDKLEQYNNDSDHFLHILDHLFIPALEDVGFTPVSPKSTGSDIIQADIIRNLSVCDLVLCDMSILNPNVFFEFGIRSALDKPVALVVDDKTTSIPFDTSIINFYKYNSRLDPWILKDVIPELASHILDANKKSNGRNSLWKYFGVSQTGVYAPEEVEIGEKFDLIFQEISSLKDLLSNRETLSDFVEPLVEEEKKYRMNKIAHNVQNLVNSLREIDNELNNIGNSENDKSRKLLLRARREKIQEELRMISNNLSHLERKNS